VLLAAATVPAGLAGLLLDQAIETRLRSPVVVGLAIPVSIVTTFAFLYFAKVGQRGFHAMVEDSCVTCHMEKSPPPAEFSYQQSATNHSFKADIGTLSARFMKQGDPLFFSPTLLASSPEGKTLLDIFFDPSSRATRLYIVLDTYPQSESALNAVTRARVYVLDDDYIFVPGPRFVLFVEKLARLIHPEDDVHLGQVLDGQRPLARGRHHAGHGRGVGGLDGLRSRLDRRLRGGRLRR